MDAIAKPWGYLRFTRLPKENDSVALSEMLTQMLKEKLGGGDDGVIESALASLLGDGEGLDIAGLVQKFSLEAVQLAVRGTHARLGLV